MFPRASSAGTKEGMRLMEVRNATPDDLKAVAAVEAECFPQGEAATEEALRERLLVYPNHFWLLFDGDRLVGFVNGMVSDEPDLRDGMYADASLHDEGGRWQMIFGVNTIPEYRRRGCAERVLRRVVSDAERQGREGLVLTCKEPLLHYYAKFGFENEGISSSGHGGAIWYQMRLRFARPGAQRDPGKSPYPVPHGWDASRRS